jgi:hypothetical protein
MNTVRLKNQLVERIIDLSHLSRHLEKLRPRLLALDGSQLSGLQGELAHVEWEILKLQADLAGIALEVGNG